MPNRQFHVHLLYSPCLGVDSKLRCLVPLEHEYHRANAVDFALDSILPCVHATAHGVTHFVVFRNRMVWLRIDPNYYENLPTRFVLLRPLRSVNVFRLTFHVSGCLASIGLSIWLLKEASRLRRPPTNFVYWLCAEIAFWVTRHAEVRCLEKKENFKASMVNMANCALAVAVIDMSSSRIVATLFEPFIARNVIHSLLHM